MINSKNSKREIKQNPNRIPEICEKIAKKRARMFREEMMRKYEVSFFKKSLTSLQFAFIIIYSLQTGDFLASHARHNEFKGI